MAARMSRTCTLTVYMRSRPMTRLQRRTLVLATAVCMTSTRITAQTRLLFTDAQWSLDAPEARIEEYRGRTAVCFWGADVHHQTVRLRDGTVEFFLALGSRRG